MIVSVGLDFDAIIGRGRVIINSTILGPWRALWEPFGLCFDVSSKKRERCGAKARPRHSQGVP